MDNFGDTVKSSKTSIPRNVVMLGIVSLLTDAASEMIYPLLPLFVVTLGSGAILLGVIEGLAESTASLLKLFSGVLSDRMGKRKMLVVIGYSISSLMRPLIGLASDAWQIVLIRTSDRVGKGIRTSPRDALIASSVHGDIRGKAFGFHRAMDHTGAVLGPILCLATVAVLIFVLDLTELPAILRATFLLALIPGALAVLTLIVFVKEQTGGASGGGTISFSLGAFSRNFRRYLFIAAFFTLGNSSDAFLLFRVQEALQQSASLDTAITSIPLLGAMAARFTDPHVRLQFANILFLPLIWSFFHMVKVLFSTPLGSLSDRVGRKVVISIGWGVYALVYAGFALLDRLPDRWQIGATFVLFTLYAVYYAFTEGAEKAYVADLSPPHLRGSAFGLFHFAVGVSALPASILFGIVYNAFGAAAAFGSGAGIATIAMIALAAGVKEERL